MKYLKCFENYYESEFNGLQRDLLTHFGYYSTKDPKIKEKALSVYSEYMKSPFSDTVVNHMDQHYFKPDRSPRLVFHSSNENFNVFRTPAFFEPTGGAYQGDIIYACVINLKNPLMLESQHYISEHGKEKGLDVWKGVVKDIIGDKEYQKKSEFIDEYLDNYGFFKIIQKDSFDYDWNRVFGYIKHNGYDGAIYKESDQAIQNFFKGYIVMDPSDIKILDKVDNDV